MNFGTANLCAAGATNPSPCSKSLALKYKITESGTLETPQVVTEGSPNLDFTLANGSTCQGMVTAGTTCTVEVKFAPKYAGTRPGGVLVINSKGKSIANTLIYGEGAGPQIAFNTNTAVELPNPMPSIYGTTVGVDGAGDVLVITTTGIVKLPADGSAGVTVFSYAKNLYPNSVAIDGVGDLFVPNNNLGYILEQPAGGGAQTHFSTPPGGIAVGIASDATGDFFVAESDDSYKGYVFKLPAGGGAPQSLLDNDGLVPESLAVNGNGDAFIVTQGDVNYMYKFAATGGSPIDLTPKGFNPDAPNSPLTVDGGGNAASGFIQVPAGGSSLITESNYGQAVDGAGDYFFLKQAAAYPYTASVYKYERSQPPVLNFGTITVGSTKTLPLTITDIGNAKLVIKPTFSNADYEIKSTYPENCLEATYTGYNCVVYIEFSSTTTGTKNGQLTLSTNGATSPVVTLLGSAKVSSASEPDSSVE